jgi:hypothetical protein
MGKVPKWLKMIDCKSAEVFYVGLNLASPNSKYTSYFPKWVFVQKIKIQVLVAKHSINERMMLMTTP